MEILGLAGAQEFSPRHHVQRFLSQTGHCSISVASWEPGQVSPIHHHPAADEIYYVLQGEGVFRIAAGEWRLGAGDTVIFPAGEVHQVESVTRMVLYRVQAGADRHPEVLDAWPAG